MLGVGPEGQLAKLEGGSVALKYLSIKYSGTYHSSGAPGSENEVMIWLLTSYNSSDLEVYISTRRNSD